MQENKLQQTNTSAYLEYLQKDLKEWEVVQKASNQYEIAIYGTPFQNTGIDIKRIQFTMKNVTIKQCQKVFGKMDESIIKEDSAIKEFKVIQETDYSQTIYQRMSPPIISDREMLVKVDVQVDNDQNMTILQQSVEHPDYPENKKYVRANVFRCLKFVQVGNDVQLEMIAFLDMKGSIPKMVLNKLASKKISEFITQRYKKAQQF